MIPGGHVAAILRPGKPRCREWMLGDPRLPPATPQCNAFAERFVRECRETLDNLILLGEGHLRHALRKIETLHKKDRPHQGIENNIPLGYA